MRCSYVEVPDSESLRLSDTATVEAWINVPLSSNYSVLSKNGCNELRQNYSLGLKQNAVHFTLVECPEYEMAVIGAAIRPNRWYHLAGSYDGKTVRVYVNGAQAGSLNRTFKVGTLEAPLYIGAISYGPKLMGYFTGKIDEVKIYDRALSGDQIAARYQAEKDLPITESALQQISDSQTAFIRCKSPSPIKPATPATLRRGNSV